MSNFLEQLEGLINSHSKENESNTPDFILAQYMSDCLDAFTKASNRREEWFGRKLEVVETISLGEPE